MRAARLGPENLDDPVLRHVREDYTTLRAEQTVEQALAELRSRALAEAILYLYVVDDAHRLVGVVPTRRLLMSQPSDRIGAIMLDRVVSVPADASVLVACEFFILYRFLAFPVVDADRRLLGIVDVSLFADEVIGLAEKRELDDVFQLIGVHVAGARSRSPVSGFLTRFPWLLCNMIGGLACALLLTRFEGLIRTAAVLAAFVPVVLALAESVSMQSMTITLASMHTRRTDWRRFFASILRELSTAALLGAASGAAIGLAAWLWRGRPAVAMAVGASIFLSMVTACLLGVALPSAVRAFRGDPRIAAGPIVLAVADIATVLFYFGLAGCLLG